MSPVEYIIEYIWMHKNTSPWDLTYCSENHGSFSSTKCQSPSFKLAQMTRPWLWSIYVSLPALIKWFWLYCFSYGTNYYLTSVAKSPLPFLWRIVIAPSHFVLFNVLSLCIPGKQQWLYLTFLRSFTLLHTGCFTFPKVLQVPAAPSRPFPLHLTAHRQHSITTLTALSLSWLYGFLV